MTRRAEDDNDLPKLDARGSFPATGSEGSSVGILLDLRCDGKVRETLVSLISSLLISPVFATFVAETDEGMVTLSSSMLNRRWSKNGFRSFAFGVTLARITTSSLCSVGLAPSLDGSGSPEDRDSFAAGLLDDLSPALLRWTAFTKASAVLTLPR